MATSATTISAVALSQLLEEFLAAQEAATVLEDGVALFDLAQSRYSISDSNGKCLLHLWSDERNIVRRVYDAGRKNGALQLSVQRFGKHQPTLLEFCGTGDRRSASAKKTSRVAYAKLLARVIAVQNPATRIESLSTGYGS
jgi:hypothetical protein